MNEQNETREPVGGAATGYATAVDAALAYADEGMNAADSAKAVLQKSPDYRLGGYNHLSLVILAAEVRRQREEVMQMAALISECADAIHPEEWKRDCGYPTHERHYREDAALLARCVAVRKSHNEKVSGRAAQKGEHE